MLSSRTTQNVLAGGVSSVSAIAAIFQLIRAFGYEVSPEIETHVTQVIIVLLLPVISRLISFKRNPEKKS